MDGIAWSKGLAALGCVLLAGCIIWTAKEIVPVETADNCQKNLSAALASQAATDDAGKLRVAGLFPDKVTLGSRLCVVVAGVAPKPADTPATPYSAAPMPVPVTLYLNSERTSLFEAANPIPGPQLLIYPFGEHTDAASDSSKFWRRLLAGQTRNGTTELTVGVASTQAGLPSASGPPIKFIIYKKEILALGAAAMLVLTLAFVVFAASSTIMRDTASLGASGKPNGTYSLGRVQMALWFMLSVAGFIFLWLTLGFYLNVITISMVALLGIHGMTGIGAIMVDRTGQAAAPPVRTSRGFMEDLICDSEGPRMHRIQAIAWTCLLAVIFVWNLCWNLVFVDFDSNLLLLMGVANGTYLGFKTQETP
jgi:hypothetical protein